MPRDSLLEAYRMMKEASVLPKNLGPGSGQADQRTVQSSSGNQMTMSNAAADAKGAGMIDSLKNKPAQELPSAHNNARQGNDSQGNRVPVSPPNSGIRPTVPPPRPANASDNVTDNKPGSPRQAMAAAQARKGFGNDAGGGNYKSAQAKPKSPANFPHLNKPAVPNRDANFPTRSEYSNAKARKASGDIAPKAPSQSDSNRTASVIRTNAERIASRTGTNKSLDASYNAKANQERKDKGQPPLPGRNSALDRPVTDSPMAKATNPGSGGVGSSLGKQSGSGTTIKKPGTAQAAAPSAPKAKDASWSQKVGKAMRDHVRKGGKAGDTIDIEGKKIKVAWKDGKVYKESSDLFNLVKEVINETRSKTPVHVRTKGDLTQRMAYTKKSGQQNMGGGSRYHNNSMATEDKDEVVTKKKVLINLDPEKKEMNGYN
jgi:hypothetical protein